jgi:hypothetical protein
MTDYQSFLFEKVSLSSIGGSIKSLLVEQRGGIKLNQSSRDWSVECVAILTAPKMNQMLNFSTAGYLGDRSPDRVDALVWAFSDLLVEPEPGAAMIEYYRLRAKSRVQCSFSRHRTGDRGKSGRVSHHLSSQSWGQQRRECQ